MFEKYVVDELVCWLCH